MNLSPEDLHFQEILKEVILNETKNKRSENYEKDHQQTYGINRDNL